MVQRELRRRSDDVLPFKDERLIKHAVRTINEEMARIKRGGGEIFYPSTISPYEQTAIRRKLAGLGERLIFVTGVPIDQGIGTVIEVRQKGV